MLPDFNSSGRAEPHGASSSDDLGEDNTNDVGDQGLEEGLPPHVNVVKKALLNFNHFLGLEATMIVLGDEKKRLGDEEGDDDDGDVFPLSAYKSDGLKESQRAKEREFLENAKELAEGAQRFEATPLLFLQNCNWHWQRLFRTVATRRAEDFNYYSGSYLPNAIACAGNDVWYTDYLDPSQSSRATSPKPDWYFGFPVCNVEPEQKTAGFSDDPSWKNYSVETLSQLAMNGLRCTPVSSSLSDMVEMTNNARVQSPLLCFPWCIIQANEGKEANTIEENDDLALETSRQASVATSRALDMLEQLARFADVKQDGQHIPPVITITSVGPNTTVWLAFSDNISDHYREHIMLDKDRETAELVHLIQDRLSSLNILPNSNLPKLIQQAVILQEVMKSDPRKTEQNQNAQDKIGSPKKFPSHPEVDPSAVEAPCDGVTENVKRETANLMSESKRPRMTTSLGDTDKDTSSGSDDKPTLQPKSLEKISSVVADLAVSKECTIPAYLLLRNYLKPRSRRSRRPDARSTSPKPFIAKKSGYLRRIVQSESCEKEGPDPQPAEILRPLQLNIRIPWKEKYIRVKLPPTTPTSQSNKYPVS